MAKIDSNKVPEVSEYETVQERGVYSANGYTFSVEPVYFKEETEYFFDVPLSLHLQESKSEITDKDLVEYFIALFQANNKAKDQESLGWFARVKLWLVKHTRKGYYSDCPGAIGMVKWIEKKVKHKGKNIRFYDLERKFKLSKLEVVRLYRYMETLSGF